MSQPESEQNLIEILKKSISDLLQTKQRWRYQPTQISPDEWLQLLESHRDSLSVLSEENYGDLLLLSIGKVTRGGFSQTLSQLPRASIHNVPGEHQRNILLLFAKKGRLHEIGNTDFIKQFLLKEINQGSYELINSILERCLLNDELYLIASPLDASNTHWRELRIVCEIIDENIPANSEGGEGILGLVPVLLMCGLLTKDRLNYLLNAEKIDVSQDFWSYIQDPIHVMENFTKEDLRKFPLAVKSILKCNTLKIGV
jgi:hypothetical protein